MRNLTIVITVITYIISFTVTLYVLTHFDKRNKKPVLTKVKPSVTIDDRFLNNDIDSPEFKRYLDSISLEFSNETCIECNRD